MEWAGNDLQRYICRRYSDAEPQRKRAGVATATHAPRAHCVCTLMRSRDANVDAGGLTPRHRPLRGHHVPRGRHRPPRYTCVCTLMRSQDTSVDAGGLTPCCGRDTESIGNPNAAAGSGRKCYRSGLTTHLIGKCRILLCWTCRTAVCNFPRSAPRTLCSQ